MSGFWIRLWLRSHYWKLLQIHIIATIEITIKKFLRFRLFAFIFCKNILNFQCVTVRNKLKSVLFWKTSECVSSRIICYKEIKQTKILSKRKIFILVIQFRWQSETTNSSFWMVNILLRKSDTLSKKQVEITKTRVLWWKTTTTTTNA